MSKQLLSKVGQFVLRAVFVGCLSALAVPATAQAADPSFDSAVCTVQSVNVPMLPPTWQIKGTGSFKDVPAGYSSVSVTVRFQMRVNSTAAWGNLFDVNQTIGVNNGVGTIDTGFQTLGAPAAGNEYRVFISGSVVASVPNPAIPMNGIGSNLITPIP